MEHNQNFYIVGVGASAGGLEALEQFFQAMPDGSGMAFVVIQHLSPDYKSMMAEILSKYTMMSVREAIEGMKVEPNHVYLIPPKKSMTIREGCLRLTEKTRPTGLELPIDIFLRSLANNSKDKSIAIILSGTGSDGTRGIRSIKEADGMVIVQSPNSSKFDGMPQSAISTGLADVISPPSDMPNALQQFILHSMDNAEQNVLAAPVNFQDPIAQILELLKDFSNVDFTQYKLSTVLRRIERRSSICQCHNLFDYIKLLQSSKNELKNLYKELLIGVTKFFRNPETFELLQERVFPQLFATKQVDEPIRVWVAGCSTGEEAYSLAILLVEYCEQTQLSREIKIFATDIDNDALQIATNGEYPESTVADVAEARLARFFEKRDDNLYCIIPKIRKKVVFAQHDLTNTPPFNKLDLISCRNLFIYLQLVAQERILQLFHFALNQNGFLLLGESESINDSGKTLFSCEEKHHKIYRTRIEIASSRPRWRDLNAVTQRHFSPQVSSKFMPMQLGKSSSRQSNDNLYKLLLDTCLPPCLLINDNLDVLFISKRATPYLEKIHGTPDYNLMRMIPEQIAIYVCTAISKALKHQKKVVYKINLGEGEAAQFINLHVQPLQNKHISDTLLLLEFEETPPLQPEAFVFDVSADARQHLADIEKELFYTRETLQATIEELESSNEELQAANEELLAANEELQSTNEELQAVNEELITVNTEYQHKIQELEELNETFDNLLRCSRIGTVFLDLELHIRRFTPAIQDEIHLLHSDIGRPFKDIRHDLNYPNLLDDLRQVMTQNRARDTEVEGETGNWYLLQMSPYLSLDGAVEGCAFSLVNISARKQAELKLQALNQDFSTLLENTSDFIYFIDKSQHLRFCSQPLARMAGHADWHELIGKNVMEVQAKVPIVMFEQNEDPFIFEQGQARLNQVKPYQDGTQHWLNTSKWPVFNHHHKLIGMFGISRDVTDIKRIQLELERAKEAAENANRAKSAFLANMSHELRTPLNAIYGFSELLAQSAELPANLLPHTQKILRGGEHLLTLINDILDLAKIEAGRIELYPEIIDLRAFLEDIESMICMRAQQKSLACTFTVTQALPSYINVDAKRLRQVLLNLLSNAVKFTEQGKISLFTDYQDGVLCFQVRDTGSGIAPKYLDMIFKPFVQAGADRYKSLGTGLGLSITQEIIALMQGQIHVESQQGQGTCFTVTIPLPSYSAPQQPKPLAQQGKIVGYQRTDASNTAFQLLVVDDMPESRKVISARLRPLGFNVSEAESGQTCLAMIEQLKPDLVLLDMRMPDMSGLEVLQQLQTRPAPPSVIIISANVYQEDRCTALALGVLDYLYKPVTLNDLAQSLQQHLPLTWQYEASTSTEVVTQTAEQHFSSEWLAELKHVVSCGDRNRLLSILEECQVQGVNLPKHLQDWVYNYEYFQILQWVEQMMSVSSSENK